MVEVAWKVCAMVLNLSMKRGVEIHDLLHEFWKGWGTGAATLEANLYQQLANISHKPLFQIFLDTRKVYDSLDRGICMYILRGYGLCQNLTCLLCHYLDT